MGDTDRGELIVLQQELEWVLNEEVPRVFHLIMQVLKEGAGHFPMPLCGSDAPIKQEKFIMSTAAHSTQDQVKCVVTVTGDTISQADINMKAAKHQHQVHRTSVTPDAPWRIQQIQDAANFLQMAMQFLQGLGVKASLRTSSETLNILCQLIKLLQKGRSSLLIPRKKTIDDLLSSRNMVCGSLGCETDFAEDEGHGPAAHHYFAGAVPQAGAVGLNSSCQSSDDTFVNAKEHCSWCRFSGYLAWG